MDEILLSVLANAGLAGIIVPLIQWFRRREWVATRWARVVSALFAAVAAAGLQYTYSADTGDLTINVYQTLDVLPVFAIEFAKQFGLQEAAYAVLRKLFARPTHKYI